MSITESFPRPDAWRRPDVLAASIFMNLLGLALPIVILQVYDRIIPQAALSSFSVLIFLVCAAICLECGLRILRAMLFASAGARYEHRTGLEGFSKLLSADYSRFSADTAGTQTERMRQLSIVRDFYAGQAATLIVDLPFVLVFVLLIWLIGGALVLVPIALLAVLVAAVYFFGDRLKSALEERTTTDRRRYNFLIETLQGAHTVKALAMENMMLRRYERLQARSARSVIRLSELNTMSTSLANTVSQLAMVLYVAFGSLAVIGQSMTLGALAAGTMLTGRVLQPVLRGLNYWTRLQGIRLAESELGEVLSLPSESKANAEAPTRLRGDIEFKDVSFRYSDKAPNLFEGLSLHIPAGSVIGITGENGCGMSTLMSLMSGIIKPQKGQVLLDGKPYEELPADLTRQQIGYMPEAGTLFHGTLLDNITMFRDGDAKLRAVEIIRLLGMEDFIVKLPLGLDTPLGGAITNTLPTGIQQRIVIARALVNDPPVILFDNAHNGLDLQSDALLLKAIEKIREGRTIVLSTYRPSFLRLCDRVYVLEGGRLREQSEQQYRSRHITRQQETSEQKTQEVRAGGTSK